MESKLVISCIMMRNWIKIYHVFKSYEQFHLLTTDGRTDGRTHTAIIVKTCGFVQYCLDFKHMLYMHG